MASLTPRNGSICASNLAAHYTSIAFLCPGPGQDFDGVYAVPILMSSSQCYLQFVWCVANSNKKNDYNSYKKNSKIPRNFYLYTLLLKFRCF